MSRKSAGPWIFAVFSLLLAAPAQASPTAAPDRSVNNPPVDCIAPPPNLVAWWPLDEEAGNLAFDLVGGNNGRLAGGPLHVSGIVDLALSFDRQNDFVEVPDNSLLDAGTGDLTVDAWIQTVENTGRVRVILDKRDQGLTGYSFYLYRGRLGLQLASGGTFRNYGSGAFVATGQPLHVAVTVDRDASDGIRFYVSGAEVLPRLDPTEFSGLSLDNAAPLRLGARSFEQTGFWGGMLDEVELFHRALAPQEISRIAQARSAGKCKCVRPGCRPVAWWPLDETSATVVAADIAGHASGPHDGTVEGPDAMLGRVAGSRLFNGQGDRIRVNDTTGLDIDLTLPAAYAFDAWINTTANGFRPILARTSPHPNDLGWSGYELGLSNGAPGFTVTAIDAQNNLTVAGGVCSSCPDLADGNWHLVGASVTHDAGGKNVVVRLYADGLLFETFPARDLVGKVLGGSLLIGALEDRPSYFFAGRIDEVEIFRESLVQADFSALFAAAGAGKCKDGLPPRTCGLSDPACPQGQYCEIPPETGCGQTVPGACRPLLSGHCVQVSEPVCGCNGQTYSNECEAAKAGISIAARGACPGGPCSQDSHCSLGSVCNVTDCPGQNGTCILGCRVDGQGCANGKTCHDLICKTCPCPDLCE